MQLSKGTCLSGEFSGVVTFRPMCGSEGLASDCHVVKLDGVVEIPAMTVSATLRSVLGVLSLECSQV